MEFHFLQILVLTYFVLKGSNASKSPAERYWQSMLPNTPMPTALHNLIQQQPGVPQNYSFMESGDQDMISRVTYELVYDVAYWNVAGKFNEESAVPNATTVFFLIGDLRPYKKMRLNFTKSTSRYSFLPRRIADSTPFSDDRFLDILKHFLIKPETKEAQIIKQTIQSCSSPSMKGEDKCCATSLESLVDLAIAKFGEKLRALSNEVDEENKEQDYTILKGIKVMGDDQMVCHKEKYPYAVFYCHSLVSTKVYMVPLIGDDGSKAKAVILCHFDTSAWDPKHLSFQVLNVKPGGPPICHFLNDDTIVWVPK